MSKRKPNALVRFFGYCTLEIPLSAKEHFINICFRYGFIYYDLKIDPQKEKMVVLVPLLQHKRILSACRVFGVRTKLISKNGFLEKAWQGRKRLGITLGLVISFLLILSSQNVVWRIDVVGNERLSKAQVIEALNSNGIRVGSKISSLDPHYIEHMVMINNDDIAWISIKIVGTVAKVEIKEVIDTEIKQEGTNPANLVSCFDAQVVSLEVYSGFLCVKEGDFVRAGELLASGIYKSEKAPLRFTRANGCVFGRVSTTFEVEIPLVQTQKVLTGEKITKKSLIFFGKSINFFTNYRNLPISYDIINYLYTLNPFSLGELPISISVDEYYPYEMVEVTISEEEAIAKAYDLLREKIDEALPNAQILKKSLHGEIVDGKYVLKCTLTAICNIAKQVEFEVR